jgi:hypothetical protein
VLVYTIVPAVTAKLLFAAYAIEGIFIVDLSVHAMLAWKNIAWLIRDIKKACEEDINMQSASDVIENEKKK